MVDSQQVVLLDGDVLLVSELSAPLRGVSTGVCSQLSAASCIMKVYRVVKNYPDIDCSIISVMGENDYQKRTIIQDDAEVDSTIFHVYTNLHVP